MVSRGGHVREDDARPALMQRCLYRIKNYSENEGIMEQLVEAGWVRM